MEKTSHLNGLPCDVTLANETNDDAFLGDTLSLSQFNVGREIGKGQFSQVYSATFLPCPSRRVAIKRVELLEMVDSKARADCVKEIQLLKMAALQPPFNCFKSNWNALRQNIERCEYPPLPSDRYSVDMRHLVGSCLQRAPTERPNAQQVFCIAKTLQVRSMVAKFPTTDPSLSRRHTFTD
ncbi:hypothetical protein DAPPUDRAFT_321694 [Daphnia pulex]|uniref:Protein kinase domain-containing protein n=1 Tax=Daphnia pulex TaxID=6669 RepID=E9GTL8_DAPPU|nr:hypothetical protein DAPPUDRAFT_321694 [Daphnia pulex]|eukprot:EFX77190.1 hypothetical protein DAPPUDRAFT_321694 [Daphnia pulex]